MAAKAPAKKAAGTAAKKPPAKKIYTCKSCGKTTTTAKHLCNPGSYDPIYTCEYCGIASIDPRHICKPKARDIQWFCADCGRVSVAKNLLCKPRQIKS